MTYQWVDQTYATPYPGNQIFDTMFSIFDYFGFEGLDPITVIAILAPAIFVIALAILHRSCELPMCERFIVSMVAIAMLWLGAFALIIWWKTGVL